jgi:uncharacterized protein DUF2252
MMSFVADNDAFESWLRTQCDVVEEDLDYKHKRMCDSPFMFLRATFFRWAKQMPVLFPELMRTPEVLTVGDLHSENFGTWRDDDGRFVWGVNDFDEASRIPYAFDLVRLATSLRLAATDQRKTTHRIAAMAIAEGYSRGLAKPRPTLLDERDRWMRRYTACSVSERRAFWQKVAKYPELKKPILPQVQQDLASRLPDGAENIIYRARRAGGGSLGRPRYVAVADWRGGKVVREAKALVSSAWDWARGDPSPTLYFERLATQKHRAPDPYLKVKDKFIFRRLAPDSRKLELGEAPKFLLEMRVLMQMGFDTGSIHASDDATAAISADFAGRPPNWLYDSAKEAAAAVESDYREWCRHYKTERPRKKRAEARPETAALPS